MFTLRNIKCLAVFVLLLINIINAYPTCQQMEINGYLYDLTQLPAQNLFVVTGNTSGSIRFAFCEPIENCNNQKAFIVNNEGNTCKIFSNKFKPMRENYTMLDYNTPKRGIKISYLPYYDEQKDIYRYTTLNLYCPSVESPISQCKYKKDSETKQSIECFYPTNGACATIKLNYFWQFLSNNSIVFAILLWIISLFQLLFGYLAIRMTIFIFGILSGSIFGIIYTAENYVGFIYEEQGYGIAVFVICLSIFMGILFGIMLLTLPRLGYVNIGLWVAVIFSLLLQNSVLYLTGSLLAFYITIGVVGLIMTIIALMKLKNYIILSTSFVSAFWIVRPLGFFLSSYPNEFLSGQTYLLNSSTQWQFYLYLIAIIILTILGAVFQFCCFKKNASGNQAYYLQQEGTLKQKFKKLLQFQEIRTFIKNGADQLKFFKQLIVQDSQSEEQGKNLIKKNNTQKEFDSQSQKYSKSSKQYQQSYYEEPQQKPRKKTKIQKQLQDFNAKKQKKSSQPYFAVKPSNNNNKNNKNRKVVEIQPSQDFSDQNQLSSEQQSFDIKPNKLNVNNKKGKR